jgi:hypothetical protein
MHLRVSIDLAGGGLEDLGPDSFCQTQHVDGTMDTRLCGLYRIKLIMDWGSRTCEIIDLVNLNIEGKGNVVPHQFEVMIIQQMKNIPFIPGKKIIDAEDIAALLQKTFTEMRTEEACAAGHENTFFRLGFHKFLSKYVTAHNTIDTHGSGHRADCIPDSNQDR